MRYLSPSDLFRHLLKARAKGPARLLGLDVGDKYVGVAVSDSNNRIASPLSVLLRKKTNIDLMADDFQCLISELSISGFVVGSPLDRGSSTTTCDGWQVKDLMEDLSRTGKLKDVCYTYWKENFTSLNAELLVRPINLHQAQLKTITDKCAAVGILECYLDHCVNRKVKDGAKLKAEAAR